MVHEVNASNFYEVIQNDYVVIDLYGNYCGGCMVLAPIFEKASNEMPFLCFGKMNIQNVEENTKIANGLGISSIPTLLFYRKGELINRVSGSMNRNTLNKHLSKLLYE